MACMEINLTYRMSKNVDIRRWEIGLPPMWYMNKIYGTELPDGYQTNIYDLESFKNWIVKRHQMQN